MARWTILGIDLSSGTIRIVLALVIGSAIIAYGAYMFWAQTSGLDSAEPVEATIVSTSVEEVGGQGAEYAPTATFEYTYGGDVYTSTYVYPGGVSREFDSEEAARDSLEAYESGDSVTAYVPTNSPGDAYLKQSRSDKPLLAIGAGAVILLSGLFKLVYRSRKM